jgi:hypothetical protein
MKHRGRGRQSQVQGLLPRTTHAPTAVLMWVVLMSAVSCPFAYLSKQPTLSHIRPLSSLAFSLTMSCCYPIHRVVEALATSFRYGFRTAGKAPSRQ